MNDSNRMALVIAIYLALLLVLLSIPHWLVR